MFFYRECLRGHILAFRDANVLCPCNEEFDCKGTVTEFEMRAVCVPVLCNSFYILHICIKLDTIFRQAIKYIIFTTRMQTAYESHYMDIVHVEGVFVYVITL